mmetsp:Transcript_6358/g.27042  ORF Transcript_6358/g.27042 Transcript_6358/m.27042 type:complete len:209 (+) Transcript_6358:224-850(+)
MVRGRPAGQPTPSGVRARRPRRRRERGPRDADSRPPETRSAGRSHRVGRGGARGHRRRRQRLPPEERLRRRRRRRRERNRRGVRFRVPRAVAPKVVRLVQQRAGNRVATARPVGARAVAQLHLAVARRRRVVGRRRRRRRHARLRAHRAGVLDRLRFFPGVRASRAHGLAAVVPATRGMRFSSVRVGLPRSARARGFGARAGGGAAGA